MDQIKRQSSRLTLLLVAGAVIASASQALRAQNAAPWQRGSISQMEPSTHPPSPPPTPAVTPLDSARLALRALDEAPPSPTPSRLPSLYRLADFEPGGSYAEGETLKERQEQALIRKLLAETDILLRNNRKELAYSSLEEALPGIEASYNRLAILTRLGTLLFRDQQYDRAVIHMREAVAIEPNDTVMVSNFAAGLLSIGDVDEALEQLSSIDLLSIRNPSLAFSVLFNLACAHSLKGDVEKALSHLVGAANLDPASTIASLGDTQLDNLRNDPRFQSLQNQLEAAFRPNR